MIMTTVTIIGCGHGGQALAADLAERNYNVVLYAHPKHPGGIEAIKQAGGICCSGLINKFVPISLVTTDLQEALAKSKYVILALPSYAHEAMFIELSAFIKPGQTVITLAANFASLLLLKLLAKTNKTSGIDIIDMASLPYVCRSDNQGKVEIVAVKNKLAAASIPSAAIHKHLPSLSLLFPCQIVPYKDVLSLGMNITNGVIHPVVALLNAGRISPDKDRFYFYRDGATPEVANIVERLDVERMRIGHRLGLEMYSFLELNAQYYGTEYKSIYDFYVGSDTHSTLLSPNSLQQRFISEDVAGCLVAWYCLGKLVQVDPIVMSNLINLASLLNNTDYLRIGTNLERLNLHDKSLTEIKHYTSNGILPSGLSISDEYSDFPRHAAFAGCFA